MLESPSTADDDDMDNGFSKSTVLEPTIKHLMKETSLFYREEHNSVRRRENVRAEISPIAKVSLKNQ